MKQVIVVNRSLSLPKGKLAAQVAHAAVGAFVAADEQAQMTWLQVGMPKIIVYAADADALVQLETDAQRQQIENAKRPETRSARIAEMLSLLKAGKKQR